MAFSVGGGSKKGVTPSMNVTPLVDVVLVLLIIFMVVTPLLSRQLQMSLPKQEDSKDDNDDNTTIVLTVDAEGIYRINNQVVEEAELSGKIERMLAPRPDKVVYFDASKDAPYAAAVTAMDIAKRSGAKGIAILTETVVQ